MAKRIKVRDLKKGQRVRVKSRKGTKVGEVSEIREGKNDDGGLAIWVTLDRPNGGFIDSMHEPDGEIELAD